MKQVSPKPSARFVQQMGPHFARAVGRTTTAAEKHALRTFGEYIAAARTALGLSQAAVAVSVARSEADVYALELGLLPRAAIDTHLLEQLAMVLQEEYPLLLLLLGESASAYDDRPPLAPHRQPTGGHNKGATTLGRPSSRRKKGRTLLHELTDNLLVCLQQSRLTVRYFTTGLRGLGNAPAMLIATVFAVFAVGWMIGHTDWAPRLPAPAGNALVTVPVVTTVTTASASVAVHPIGSESVAFAAVTDATSYHIIYRARNSAEFNSQTAYIIVDETRLAQIQFKPATAVPTRSCVHSGRFDLCPI